MKKRLFSILVSCALVLSMAALLTGCDNPFKKETYTPTSKDAELTTPTIGVSGTLRVGVNTSNPPLAGQSSKIVGIDVDIAAALADLWGLKLEIVDVGANPLTSLQNGKVDLVLGVDVANTDTALAKSTPYIKTGVAFFSLNENASLPTAESKISAQATSMSAWKVSSHFGADSMVNASDLKSAFGNLADEKCQYVAADAVIGQYAAYTAGVDAYLVGTIGDLGGYCAATMGTNTQLTAQVASGLQKLASNGTIALIEKKWMGRSIDAAKVPAVKVTEAKDATKPATDTKDADKKEQGTTEEKSEEKPAA